MSEREKGWYWVKQEHHHNWRPDFWRDGKWRSVWSMPEDDGCHAEVGPRIPTPDEPWQCVPVEMTPDMGEAVKGYNRFIDWKEALAAAPKPGGGW